MSFIGVEVEQKTSAPPPKKILDPPLAGHRVLVYLCHLSAGEFIDWSKEFDKVSYRVHCLQGRLVN